jgi:hypothetical protein
MNPSTLEQRQAVDPMLDGFLKSAAANAIREIGAYVEAGSVSVPALAVVSPAVGRAADLFAQGQYTAALAQAFLAYQNIAALRAAVPAITDLPAL